MTKHKDCSNLKPMLVSTHKLIQINPFDMYMYMVFFISLYNIIKVKTSSKMTHPEVNRTEAFLIHEWSYMAPYMCVFHRVSMKYFDYGSSEPLQANSLFVF